VVKNGFQGVKDCLLGALNVAVLIGTEIMKERDLKTERMLNSFTIKEAL